MIIALKKTIHIIKKYQRELLLLKPNPFFTASVYEFGIFKLK